MFLCLLYLTASAKALCLQVDLFVCPFVRSDVVAMMSREWLNSFGETDREYSLAHTDDLIRFWRSGSQ